MTWILVVLTISGTDVTAQTHSTHPSMMACFEARQYVHEKGMQGPEVLCVRAKETIAAVN